MPRGHQKKTLAVFLVCTEAILSFFRIMYFIHEILSCINIVLQHVAVVNKDYLSNYLFYLFL
jgi:hypothetical protein